MSQHRIDLNFQVLSKLGEGAFGQVYKVRRKEDNQIYAMKKIKMMHMKEKDRANALNEVRILASHKGNNIIGYKESFYEEESGYLCVVMEYAMQGDLLHRIHKYTKQNRYISEEEIWKALVEISLGLYSLHKSKVLHRDLKSANIFIMEDGTYKLGDLNVSKVIKYQLAKTQTGTPYYASPEVWKDRPYGIKSDMWSLGCVLYEMASKRPPFMANDIPGLYRKISIGKYPSIPEFYSSELSQIIKKLLNQNPNYRPSSTQILSNKLIQEKYSGKIAIMNQQSNSLLKTIKPDHKDWRQINKNLPQSNYQIQSEEVPRKSRRKSRKTQGSRCPTVTRSQKQISVQKLIKERIKINNFVTDLDEKKSQKSSDKHQIKVRQQRIRLPQSKQRILSAGRIRNPSIQLFDEQIQQIVEQCSKDKPIGNKLKSNVNIIPKNNLPPLPSPLIISNKKCDEIKKPSLRSKRTPQTHNLQKKSSAKNIENRESLNTGRSKTKKVKPKTDENTPKKQKSKKILDEVMRVYRDD